MERRSGRAAAKRAAAALESTPRKLEPDDDVVMPDAETSDAEPQPDDEDEDDEGEGNNDVEEDDEAGDDDEREEAADDDEEEKEPTPPPMPVIRKKRLGRPPKNRPPDWDQQVVQSDADATPRRRGRGGYRGRGGRKGGPAPIKQQQVIDKEGTVADILNDELVLPEDPEGETKVDSMGNLLGGRDYRCRTFTVLGRGDRLYMLSTEPARCVGFRDSYLFFTKHLRLYKIIADEEEKRDMIDREIIPHSYKGRAIGIVTARSVFREFGARMIVGGKRIIDDYNVSDARAEGIVEGEIADPTDHFIEGEPYNKNQYVAWHGASSVYHQSTPAVPIGPVKVEVKKRRVNVNDTNWMLEHSREASTFNARINAIRHTNLRGIYDIHTNTMQYPAHMQPTRAVFQEVSPEESDGDAAKPASSVFPPLDPKIRRNYLVIDSYSKTPKVNIAAAAYEDVDPNDLLAPFRGLGAVSDEIKDLLPPDCRKAFEEALAHEVTWKEQWKEAEELEKASRRQLIIDKTVVPYHVHPRDA